MRALARCWPPPRSRRVPYSGASGCRHQPARPSTSPPRGRLRSIDGPLPRPRHPVPGGPGGLPPKDFAGHSLKRGALTTGMQRGAHPAQLKRLGRHESFGVLGEYLAHGDLLDPHALADMLYCEAQTCPGWAECP